MKNIYLALTIVVMLLGCSSKQDAILKAHNEMDAAENAFLAAFNSAGDLEERDEALEEFQLAIRNIDTKGCPADYASAMSDLLFAIGDMVIHGNPDLNGDPEFIALDAKRLNAAAKLNELAESHGLEIR